MSAGAHTSQPPPLVVIDTQAVLDWCYFQSPSCASWSTARERGAWHWIASQAMRDELAHVLARGFGTRWPGDAAAVLGAFDRFAQVLPSPTLSLAQPLRCSDTDDQKFIDLAIASGARWLVSRDRAVLKLARRALARHGLEIVRPADWRFANLCLSAQPDSGREPARDRDLMRQ